LASTEETVYVIPPIKLLKIPLEGCPGPIGAIV
jgi:hypothetical protein